MELIMIEVNHLTNSVYLSISLTYEPPVPIPGDTLTIYLNRDGQFSSDHKLIVELVAETGKTLITLEINSSNEAATLEIPNDCEEGTYILQVIDNKVVLDSTEIDIFEDKNYAEKTNSFVNGLELEIQIKEEIEKEDYEEAFKLQEMVEEHYKHNLKFAAKSWEEFAEVLYEKKQIELSRKALDEALEIYKKIENSDYKEKIIERINHNLEIVKRNLLKTKLQILREKKGYSQDQLALLLKTNPDQIKAWEAGKGCKELLPFYKLAKYLKCKIDDLIKIDYDSPKQLKLNKLLDKNKIRSRIRYFREENTTLNVDQLALLVGVEPEEIKKWEDNKELEILIKYFRLALRLDCKPSELFDYVDGTVKLKLSEVFSKQTNMYEDSIKSKK